MALNTLKGKDYTPSGVTIINMANLKDLNPELFPDNGMQMDYKVFEKDVRPNFFIYVRDDANSLSFTLQNGPINEVGVNGCQVTDVIEVAKMIIEGLNQDVPCRENSMTITKLDEALMWQRERTRDRLSRGVEGYSGE